MIGNTENKQGRMPDFSSNEYGVAVWTNLDKNKKPYLSINIPALGLKNIACFKIESKKTEEVKAEPPKTPLIEEEKV